MQSTNILGITYQFYVYGIILTTKYELPLNLNHALYKMLELSLAQLSPIFLADRLSKMKNLLIYMMRTLHFLLLHELGNNQQVNILTGLTNFLT